jgi:hypothetical protein
VAAPVPVGFDPAPELVEEPLALPLFDVLFVVLTAPLPRRVSKVDTEKRKAYVVYVRR